MALLCCQADEPALNNQTVKSTLEWDTYLWKFLCEFRESIKWVRYMPTKYAQLRARGSRHARADSSVRSPEPVTWVLEMSRFLGALAFADELSQTTYFCCIWWKDWSHKKWNPMATGEESLSNGSTWNSKDGSLHRICMQILLDLFQARPEATNGS